MMEERKYQTDLIETFSKAVKEGHRRILLQSFMGSGKTLTACAIVKHAIDNGLKVLWLVHRRELIFQAIEALNELDIHAIPMLSGDPYASNFSCVVASVQTLHSWCIKRKKEKLPEAGLVVQDEAHHSSASTFVAIHNLYPNAVILGLTATPITKTGKGLAAHFDTMIQGPSVKWLMDNGYLVKEIKYVVPSVPDLSKIRISRGDYVESELENALDKPELIGDVVKNWLHFSKGKQTLIFCTGVQHSMNTAHAFRQAGINTEHIDAKTPKEDRDSILSRFKKKEVTILTNCQIFSEGTDIPNMETLVFNRPTKSLGLYLQVAGRVLRASQGKDSALIIDHAGVIYEHGKVNQDWEWSLEYNKDYGLKRATMARKRRREALLCHECKIYFEGRIDCPGCHWRPEIKGKPVETIEAWLTYLEETDPDKPLENPQHWYLMLKCHGYQQHMKNPDGWAAHKYREKFGKWPGPRWKSLAPIEPTSEVKQWIYEQKQKWLKSEEGQRWIRSRPDWKPPQREIPANVLSGTEWVQN